MFKFGDKVRDKRNSVEPCVILTPIDKSDGLHVIAYQHTPFLHNMQKQADGYTIANRHESDLELIAD